MLGELDVTLFPIFINLNSKNLYDKIDIPTVKIATILNNNKLEFIFIFFSK